MSTLYNKLSCAGAAVLVCIALVWVACATDPVVPFAASAHHAVMASTGTTPGVTVDGGVAA
ncbi:MAG: hypothetical protein M3R41_09365 [Pseudomonadota bacterium]|nr:hypothetical protein [Pseudomonadota bacterium]